MRITTLKGLRLTAVCGCPAEHLVDNQQSLASHFDEKSDQLLRASGIMSRSVAARGTSSLDLCIAAARHALDSQQIDRERIAAVVSVSFTPAFPLPGNAAPAQDLLGLAQGIPTLDILAHCAGYPYGLWVAGSLAQLLGGDVLLLCGDVQTPIVSPEDAATFPLFGDAGSATLISVGGEDEWFFAFTSDGSRNSAIHLPVGGSANPLEAHHLEMQEQEGGSRRREVDIAMNGLEIYRFVVQDVRNFILEFMQQRDHTPAQYDAFIPHQANMKLLAQLTKKLGFAEDRVWHSGERYGNVASASIPLTIALRAPQEFSGEESHALLKRCLIAGFGAGLTACVVDLPLHPETHFGMARYGSSEATKNLPDLR